MNKITEYLENLKEDMSLENLKEELTPIADQLEKEISDQKTQIDTLNSTISTLTSEKDKYKDDYLALSKQVTDALLKGKDPASTSLNDNDKEDKEKPLSFDDIVGSQFLYDK